MTQLMADLMISSAILGTPQVDVTKDGIWFPVGNGVSDFTIQGEAWAFDFDAANRRIIERCESVSPASVKALKESIDTWKKKNQAALVIYERAGRQVFPTVENYSKINQIAIKNIDAINSSDLLQACNGNYAKNIFSHPLWDINSWLEHVKIRAKSSSEPR